MTIEFKDGTFFSRVFYAEIHTATSPGNFMGAVYKDPTDGSWRFKYRFRWYKDDDLTRASKDVRSWYEVKQKDPSGPVESDLDAFGAA
jgi:hypothetical protein